ncbi:hypothetical protein LPY66_18330 [Dehalobacter sp. DCM]|nr:hypothetical protein LPY66_18330 [Dehalobacter sp. DCM]
MLKIVPIDFQEANEFVRRYHRHHQPIKAGYKFCVGAAKDDEIIGVAIVGLPIARHLMDGWTLEVRRTCTDGTKNANSILYGACWKVAKALGYRKLITYTLPSESGATMRAVGWTCIGETKGHSWNCPSRPRVDMHPTQNKLRWEKEV